MNRLTEDVIEAVVMNFRRLMPTQRRHVLQQLIADLDLPPPEENGTEHGISKTETASGSLLAWLEENVSPAELEMFLAARLPNFSRSVLTDPQQRLLLERQLPTLSPLVLYELHRNLSTAGKAAPLTPAEIVEKTWGTIRATDPNLLREIIEDEEYCGY
jgi:hypothetical protein